MVRPRLSQRAKESVLKALAAEVCAARARTGAAASSEQREPEPEPAKQGPAAPAGQQFTPQFLLQHPLLLRDSVRATKGIWVRVSRRLRLRDTQIYHWFFETWVRQNCSTHVTPEDRALIQRLIEERESRGLPLDPEFRAAVRGAMRQCYDRVEFNVVYNNVRTSIRARIQRRATQLDLDERGDEEDEAAPAVGFSSGPDVDFSPAAKGDLGGAFGFVFDRTVDQEVERGPYRDPDLAADPDPDPLLGRDLRGLGARHGLLGGPEDVQLAHLDAAGPPRLSELLLPSPAPAFLPVVDTISVPGVSVVPELPGVSGAPGLPGVSSVSGVHGIPGVSGVPDGPNVPGPPGIPLTPGDPDVASLPAPDYRSLSPAFAAPLSVSLSAPLSAPLSASLSAPSESPSSPFVSAPAFGFSSLPSEYSPFLGCPLPVREGAVPDALAPARTELEGLEALDRPDALDRLDGAATYFYGPLPVPPPSLGADGLPVVSAVPPVPSLGSAPPVGYAGSPHPWLVVPGVSVAPGVDVPDVAGGVGAAGGPGAAPDGVSAELPAGRAGARVALRAAQKAVLAPVPAAPAVPVAPGLPGVPLSPVSPAVAISVPPGLSAGLPGISALPAAPRAGPPLDALSQGLLPGGLFFSPPSPEGRPRGLGDGHALCGSLPSPLPTLLGVLPPSPSGRAASACSARDPGGSPTEDSGRSETPGGGWAVPGRRPREPEAEPELLAAGEAPPRLGLREGG